ncbi:hypothetical protein Ancab_020187 [Ancistrocladus abbreviatus]
MTTITASSSTSMVARASLVHNGKIGFSSFTVLGLPAIAEKGGVRCAMEGQSSSQDNGSALGLGASLVTAAAAAAAAMSSPAATALVDERMSTEGTGLPFGLSNTFSVGFCLVCLASSGLSTLCMLSPL